MHSPVVSHTNVHAPPVQANSQSASSSQRMVQVPTLQANEQLALPAQIIVQFPPGQSPLLAPESPPREEVPPAPAPLPPVPPLGIHAFTSSHVSAAFTQSATSRRAPAQSPFARTQGSPGEQSSSSSHARSHVASSGSPGSLFSTEHEDPKPKHPIRIHDDRCFIAQALPAERTRGLATTKKSTRLGRRWLTDAVERHRDRRSPQEKH
jgi:hypothetical protein